MCVCKSLVNGWGSTKLLYKNVALKLLEAQYFSWAKRNVWESATIRYMGHVLCCWLVWEMIRYMTKGWGDGLLQILRCLCVYGRRARVDNNCTKFFSPSHLKFAILNFYKRRFQSNCKIFFFICTCAPKSYFYLDMYRVSVYTHTHTQQQIYTVDPRCWWWLFIIGPSTYWIFRVIFNTFLYFQASC